MKIYQLVENATSAAQLKQAFTREEWVRILLHFAGERNLGLGSSDAAIRSSLQNAFRRIGPDMPDATLPDAWNTAAVRFGAQLPSVSGVSWPGIYNHLAAHKNAEVPQQFSNFNLQQPPGSSMTGWMADTDKTPETPQQVSAWAEAPAQLNRDQAVQYFRDWMTALARHRDSGWIAKLRRPATGSDTNSSLRRLYAIQEELTPSGSSTVEKSAIDQALYSWLTSSDYTFAE